MELTRHELSFRIPAERLDALFVAFAVGRDQESGHVQFEPDARLPMPYTPTAWLLAYGRRSAHPEAVVRDHDNRFVAACQRLDRFELPPNPPVRTELRYEPGMVLDPAAPEPRSYHPLEVYFDDIATVTAMPSPIGWARALVGVTGGAKHHAHHCPSLRGPSPAPGDIPSVPLWMLTHLDRCARCDGPQIRTGAAYLTFRYASDCWYRDGEPEPVAWQRDAVNAVLVQVSRESRRSLDPYREHRDARILAALADGIPGWGGWEMYDHLIGRPVDEGRLGRELALTLALDRVRHLARVAAEHTNIPPEPPDLIDPDAAVDPPRLWQWCAAIDARLGIRHLLATVFGLPGALR